MNKATIAFIGAGHMATSLISGLIKDGYPADNIIASNVEEKILHDLKAMFNIQVTTDNQKAAEKADVVILCLKPQVLKTVALELQPIVQVKKSLVLSIAAGIDTKHLGQWLGEGIHIVRCMPNLPALVGSGASGLYANSHVGEKEKELAESIIRSVGLVVWVQDEAQMDIITALSGSGPAYFFLMMEAMVEAAVKLGLPENMAQLLTMQTAFGSAKIAFESSLPIAKLRQQVTSPGGTTEQALQVLQQHHFLEIMAEAIKKAQERAHELRDMV